MHDDGVRAMSHIAVVGSSGHAKVVIDAIEQGGMLQIVGLIDSFREVGDETFGYHVLGTDQDLPVLVGEYGIDVLVVAIGDNVTRATVMSRIAASVPHVPFASIVHPRAVIGKNAVIGAGTVVLAGAVVGPCSAIGQGCIVNTHASLDHDCVMQDYSSLAPGVVSGGDCHIGTRTAICIGAVLGHRVSVGANSVVGAGSTVLDDIEPHTLVYGTPARRIRAWSPGDTYL